MAAQNVSDIVCSLLAGGKAEGLAWRPTAIPGQVLGKDMTYYYGTQMLPQEPGVGCRRFRSASWQVLPWSGKRGRLKEPHRSIKPVALGAHVQLSLASSIPATRTQRGRSRSNIASNTRSAETRVEWVGARPMTASSLPMTKRISSSTEIATGYGKCGMTWTPTCEEPPALFAVATSRAAMAFEIGRSAFRSTT